MECAHKALVNHAIFNVIQQRIQVKQPRPRAKPENILRGLLFCSGSNIHMAFTSASGRKACGHYSYSNYRRYGCDECSTHFISVKQIKAIVLL